MNQITMQNVYQTTTSPVATLGQRAQTPDGRQWVYIQSGVALSAGHIVVPAAVTAVGTTITSSTDTSGRIVFITKASAGWTPGAFAEGTVYISAGGAIGQVAKIRGNTTDTLELYPENALTTALTGASTMSIWTQNVVRKSVVTTKIQNATGVVQTAFNANEYGWALTRGLGVIISTSATLTAGTNLTTGGSTAGEALVGVTATGPFDAQNIAVTVVSSTTASTGVLAFINIY